ncbi:fibronectin type III domain-containing protein 1-like isoform X2 [Haliotis rufescens]|uniref:fibronectin type III domain-containing protein 1-like isoform X2 n=1 Tax=Haliotis rufescens TaxID=6454 RepID=UPI00201ED9A1|nr:fibronectin type III domain-containing protein 1-like isoform X2 [Haliotis rufescens]
MDMYSRLCFMLTLFILESVPLVLGSDTVPGKVSNLKTTLVTSSAIGLSWTASTSNIPFTNYVIFIIKEGKCTQADYIRCSRNHTLYTNGHCTDTYAGATATFAACHGDMSYNVTAKLTSYTDYVVAVAAAYEATVGENSTLTAKTQIGIPAPPTNIRLTAQNQSAILVEWDIPLHNAGPTWYNVTVLGAINRTSSIAIVQREYKVEGWKSSSYEVTDLLSSWRYMVSITASTNAGTSDRTTSQHVRTLPSAPGAVQNIHVKFVPSQYLAARLIWECPAEKMRNGRITSYTIIYTGNGSMTMTAGSYYPEDPCTTPHTAYLPVIPDGQYTVQVWANAEFQGNKSTMIFVADRNNPHSLIIVSSTCGSIIAMLFVAVIALVITRSRGVSQEKRLYMDR